MSFKISEISLDRLPSLNIRSNEMRGLMREFMSRKIKAAEVSWDNMPQNMQNAAQSLRGARKRMNLNSVQVSVRENKIYLLRK